MFDVELSRGQYRQTLDEPAEVVHPVHRTRRVAAVSAGSCSHASAGQARGDSSASSLATPLAIIQHSGFRSDTPQDLLQWAVSEARLGKTRTVKGRGKGEPKNLSAAASASAYSIVRPGRESRRGKTESCLEGARLPVVRRATRRPVVMERRCS